MWESGDREIVHGANDRRVAASHAVDLATVVAPKREIGARAMRAVG